MEKAEIIIDGKSYPCRITMGAYLRYKRETGKDFEEEKAGNVTLATLMWCCAVSSSKHDNREFPLTLEEFADAVSPNDVASWFVESTKALSAEMDAGSEKKRQE